MALNEDVARTMRVLELLAPEPDGVRISRIADELGVNKAIAHRLLAALMATGYAEQDHRTSTYFATYRLGGLGLRQLSQSGVEAWAQRTLDSLAGRCEELVRLAVASRDTLQFIAKAQGSNSRLRFDPVMGQDAIPHATATGKAWLATLPNDRVDAILARSGLGRQTSRTVVDVDALKAELVEVRNRGYATVFEEMDIGINASAAPVFGAGRDAPATGTVGISGPSVRVTPRRLEELADPLIDAAADLAASWPAYAYLAEN